MAPANTKPGIGARIRDRLLNWLGEPLALWLYSQYVPISSSPLPLTEEVFRFAATYQAKMRELEVARVVATNFQLGVVNANNTTEALYWDAYPHLPPPLKAQWESRIGRPLPVVYNVPKDPLR